MFIAWTRRYHDRKATFVLMLHLHEGNDEGAAKECWRAALNLPDADFHKTFIKPRGTGHRRNRLPWGVCRVFVRRSTDAWLRTMEWVDVLAANLPSGR